MICMWRRFSPTKRQLVNGVVLERGAASSRFYAASRISLLSCASAGLRKGQKNLWVAKYIRLECALELTNRGKGAGLQKAKHIASSCIRILLSVICYWAALPKAARRRTR